MMYNWLLTSVLDGDVRESVLLGMTAEEVFDIIDELARMGAVGSAYSI